MHVVCIYIYIRTYIYIAYPKLARPAYALYLMNAYLLEQVGGLVEGMSGN